MAVFVAIDAGGTKTRCRFADETRVLAELTGETVKIMSVGEESATATLQELVRGAAEVAGVRLDAV